MRLCFPLLFLTFLLIENHSHGQLVTTLAGNSVNGSRNGVGTIARFYNPRGLAVDSAGNILVADSFNHMIRKITAAGDVSRLVGAPTNNLFNSPVGIAIDSSGIIYISDTGNNRIRKFTPDGTLSILAGSSTSVSGSTDSIGTNARFSSPMGITTDSRGNIYVADQGNSRIRKVTPTGVVTTVSGSTVGSTDGLVSSAKFNFPCGITTDLYDNLYVADTLNYKIRKISVGGVVSTLAGVNSPGFADGVGTSAFFAGPTDLAVDIIGNVYVADNDSFTIRKVAPDGVVTTVAGRNMNGYNDGIGSSALFNAPSNIARGLDGELYISDVNNQRIRKLNLSLSCPPGTFISDVCFDCMPGTYSEVINSTSCLSCPPGTFSSTMKSTSCLDCPIGSFCPTAGSPTSNVCSVNKYCPLIRMTLPLDCPSNSATLNVGSQSVDDCICDPGFYRNNNDCIECPAGFYCPWNSTSAIKCPTGHFCPSPRQFLPTICPQGYYCPETGLSIAMQCVKNSGTLGPGSISNLDCICDQGYSLSNGNCISTATTTIQSLGRESVMYSSKSVNSATNVASSSSQLPTDSSSLIISSTYDYISYSDIPSSLEITSNTSRNIVDIVGLALSNPFALTVLIFTCLVLLITIFNICRKQIRLSKARNRRKHGIIAEDDVLLTSGDSSYSEKVADA